MPDANPSPLASASTAGPRLASGVRVRIVGGLAQALAVARGFAGALVVVGLVVAGAGCGGGNEARLAEVRALQEVGDFAGSVETLREILAGDPDHAEANYLLGLALVQTNQSSLAIWPLRKSSDSEEHGFLSRLLLASTLLQTEGFEEAIVTADKLLEAAPDHMGALLIRVHANLAVGRDEDALEDADRLLDIDPGHFHALAARATALLKMERVDEAEATWLKLDQVSRESGDPKLASRGCISLIGFYASVESDKLEETIRSCVEEHPVDLSIIGAATTYWDGQDQPEKGTEILAASVEDSPDEFGLRLKLAQRHDRLGDKESAEAVLVKGAELFDDAQAWDRLAAFRMRHGDMEGAREATGRALERVGTENIEPLLFRKADLLVLAGDIEAAEEIGDRLEQDVYRSLVRGRVLGARGDYEGALEAYEAGLARWPNNGGARFMAGQAAERLGLRAKALSHYREAVRADKTGTDGGLSAAIIQLEDGNFEDAASLATQHIENRPFLGPEAHVVATRAQIAAGDYVAARHTIDDLSQVKGQELTVVIERAALERRAQGPAEAAAVVEVSGLDLTDPTNALALGSLADDLIALGRSAESLARVDAALARAPEVAALYDMRGRVLFGQGDLATAKKAFERATELDPKATRAHDGLARIALREGRPEEALAHADRAAANEEHGDAAHFAAQIVASMGRVDEAMERLRAVLHDHPGHAGAANDLAWHLAERGEELPRALELAQRAARLEPRAEFLDTLGWVSLKRGDAAAAADAFERSLELAPTASSVRYRMALALEELGRTDEALHTLREALGGAAFPEAEQAQAEIARLEAGTGAPR